ncbi:MAG: NAD(P)-dependent oxidoreductase [Chloroflexi bacterium]|nr:NAD(P)-dependent oxidoreductase [Chloroflexota bacterium]
MPNPLKIAVAADDMQLFNDGPHLDRLREYGQVSVHPNLPKTVEEQIARSAGAQIVVGSSSALDWPAEVFNALPDLKLFTSATIGMDSVDLAAAAANGVTVCNVPGKTSPVVAEHALALMLAAARRLPAYTAALRGGAWPNVHGTYLAGKTLGIVGTGNSGAHLARLARGIGMDVIAWTFNPSEARAAELGVRFVELDDLLRTADVVSLHVRLTRDTRHLISKRQFAMMKPGSFLINVARGPIVDTDALVEALNTGHLAGAGVDVFDSEPIPKGHPLLACENAVLTPHRADKTPEGNAFLADGVVENVTAYLAGHPQNVVTAS